MFDDVTDPYWQEQAKRLRADKQRRMQVLADLEAEGHIQRNTKDVGGFGKHKQNTIICNVCGEEVIKRAPNHKTCSECKPAWR